MIEHRRNKDYPATKNFCGNNEQNKQTNNKLAESSLRIKLNKQIYFDIFQLCSLSVLQKWKATITKGLVVP